MKNNNKAILLALLAVFMWSTVAVSFKIALEYFHFIHFLFFSISVAVIISFINLLIRKEFKLLFSLTPKEYSWSVLGGFLNPFVYYLMLFKAYQILPAQIAQALNYTWPIALVLLSIPILKQKLSIYSFFILLLGFLGVYLIASEGKPFSIQPSEPLGVLLAISTSVIWALFWLINTRSKIQPSLNLFLNFLTGFILIVPLFLYVPFNYVVPFKGWIAVIYAGIFEMGITFIIWLAAMRTAERTDKISNYVFLSPFISLFFIRLVLGESIYLTTVVGLGTIVISILLKQFLDFRASR